MVAYGRKRAKTRETLLRAGMEIVAQRGLGGLVVADVAAQAGVVSGTFYNHFANREAFMTAVATELAADLHFGAEAIRALEGDPAGRIALAIIGLVRRAGADRQFGAAFAAFAAAVPALTSRVRELTAEAIADGAARGRLDALPDEETVDAVVGITVEAVRSQVAGRTGPAAAARTAVLALRMLGVGGAEAERVVASARRAGVGRVALEG